MGKDTDKMYITHSEWSTLNFGHGGFKNKPTGKEFKRLPYYCCALSLTPFEHPRCTADGFIFDLIHIVPWLKKHGTNPVTGTPLAAKDLITLHFHKNSDGDYHDPITYKVFTENTHIVAVKNTGHVYAYETIDELNVKAKNWKCLMTDEPFKRKDLITIQDPHNLTARDINQFHYKKNDIPNDSTSSSNTAANEPAHSSNINAKGATSRVLASLKASSASAKSDPTPITPSFVAPKSKTYSETHFSDNVVAGSFTSLGAVAYTNTLTVKYTDDEYLIREMKKGKGGESKGVAVMVTSLGDIEVELLCVDAPRTCFNFIQLAKTGYYKDIIFHRNIKNFMIQTGDPTGTGRGGKSYFGDPFEDECKATLSHDSRGLLSMANRGPCTNTSQFFITYKPCSHLDMKHTIFGKILSGTNVLNRMEAVETDESDKPLQKIVLHRVDILTDPFEKMRNVLTGQDEESVQKKKEAEARKARHAAVAKSENRTQATSTTGGIGKYLNLSRTIDDLEAENSGASVDSTHDLKKSDVDESNVAMKKKVKTKGGFGDFSSW